jgi:hypothetical protein
MRPDDALGRCDVCSGKLAMFLTVIAGCHANALEAIEATIVCERLQRKTLTEMSS